MPLAPLNLTDTLKAGSSEALAAMRAMPELGMYMAVTPDDWLVTVYVPITRQAKDQTETYESL